MSSREPVLLTVLIQTQTFRWHVGSIGNDGTATPLVCSQEGNLRQYVGQPFDEQVSFLRHRLSGVLQRGCDRLFGRNQKPSHIAIIVDDYFPESTNELTQRVADHFVEWMTNPPVAFFMWNDKADDQPMAHTQLAGNIPRETLSALSSGLTQLSSARKDEGMWEVISHAPKS